MLHILNPSRRKTESQKKKKSKLNKRLILLCIYFGGSLYCVTKNQPNNHIPGMIITDKYVLHFYWSEVDTSLSDILIYKYLGGQITWNTI